MEERQPVWELGHEAGNEIPVLIFPGEDRSKARKLELGAGKMVNDSAKIARQIEEWMEAHVRDRCTALVASGGDLAETQIPVGEGA
jgi:hypothetical protein